MKNFVIAIDGPAASGKSTTARLVAKQLGWIYVDTGAMYRAVTLAVLQQGVSIDDSSAVSSVSATCVIEFVQTDSVQKVLLDGADVTELIRSVAVTAAVSKVSSYPEVRAGMVHLQREAAKRGPVVMDGRDIGTVVFPNADVKVFLVASIEERARRRKAELERSATNTSVESLIQEIADRDRFDAQREHSPLRPAPDAVELDTTHLSIEQQVNVILSLVASAQNRTK